MATSEASAKHQFKKNTEPAKQDGPTLKNIDKERLYLLKKTPIFPQIHQMLIEQRSMTDIITFMQSEGYFKDLRKQALIHLLTYYRKQIPKENFLKAYQPSIVKELAKEAKKQVNVLDELTKLYEIQQKRLLRAVSIEDQCDLNFTYLDSTVKMTKDLLTSIHDVQTDLGLTPKHLGTLDINAQVIGGIIHKLDDSNVRKVLENPVSKYKVLNVAERLMAIAADGKNKESEDKSLDALTNILKHRQSETIEDVDVIVEQEVDLER